MGRISQSVTGTPAFATCQAASVPARPAPITTTEDGSLKDDIGVALSFLDQRERKVLSMRFGMEKDQFTKFRMALLSSSGFQTAAYRRIEIACTDLKNLVIEERREGLENADYHEQLDNIYWRRGAIVEETGEKALTLRDFEKKYLQEFHDFADEYQPINIWNKFMSLSDKDQTNEALISELRTLDVNVNVNWPLIHYRTAVHYLSKGTGDEKGTGGTNWQKYLPPRFQKRMFYPKLWSEQEKKDWGKKWVEQVLADSISTGQPFQGKK